MGPLGLTSRTVNPIFPLFFAYLLLISFLSLLNLGRARQQSRSTTLGGPFDSLFIATAITASGAAYTSVGSLLQLDLVTFPAEAAYGLGIILLGYAVAKYDALLEGRTIDRDLVYSSLTVGALTTFYVLIVLVLYFGGQLSFLTLVLTIVGSISANSLFDGPRIALDRFFYQKQFQQLRANLRTLAREAGTGDTLREQLQAILNSLCRALRIKQGFIARRQPNDYLVEATLDANAVGQIFTAPALAASEIVGIVRPTKVGLQDMTLLVPLYASGSQIGALVLGAKETKQPYSEAELELLEDLGGQIANVIYAQARHEENAQALNAMLDNFRQRERELQLQVQQILAERAEMPAHVNKEISEGEMASLVEDGLRQLHDFDYLGEHALAKLNIVQARVARRQNGPATFIDRGKALSETLVQALNKLRPDGIEPNSKQVAPREWHQYIILHDSYVLGEPNRNIMSRLYISEGTFNRTRRRAIRSVAKALEEMEQETRRN